VKAEDIKSGEFYRVLPGVRSSDPRWDAPVPGSTVRSTRNGVDGDGDAELLDAGGRDRYALAEFLEPLHAEGLDSVRLTAAKTAVELLQDAGSRDIDGREIAALASFLVGAA